MKIKKIWDNYIKPAGLGIGSTVMTVLPGCGEMPVPDYNVPNTKIEDKYKKSSSDELVSKLKEDIKNVGLESADIYDKADNDNWNGVVDAELSAIDIATSLAVRSVVEKEKYDYEYPKTKNESRKNFLNMRVHNLFYNQNIAINNVLDGLKIDPMLQTVMQGDSISIGDYLDDEESRGGGRFLEYRINFLDGGEKNMTDNGKMYFDPRKIIFSVYDWGNDALGVYAPSSAKPQLKYSKELELDFENNNYTFRDIKNMALEK